MSTANPMTEPQARRTLPAITDLNREFWTGGAAGELRILRCQTCGTWRHPPRPMCARCHGRDLRYETMSGTGTVFSFVVNHRQWRPGLQVPYVIVLVELDDESDLRLTSTLIGCPPEDVVIGMAVKVAFDEQDGVFVPIFEPAGTTERVRQQWPEQSS